MDFLTLQNSFEELNLDSRATWKAGGANNKASINDAYKEVYLKIIVDRSVQEIMKTDKTLVSITDKQWTLPVDFLQPVCVYFKIWDTYLEIDKDDTPYRFMRDSWSTYIVFSGNPQYSVYIEYIPVLTALSWDSDEITFPEDFAGDILNYAMVQYHRRQRDRDEVSNELNYAEGKLADNISNFWLE